MTTNEKESKSGYGARDQRPQVTLDLKATEVHSEAAPGSTEAGTAQQTAGDARGDTITPPDPETPPRIENSDAAETKAEEPQPRAKKRIFSASTLNEASVQAFTTHLAAGLLGSLIALVAAYYGAGAFRERLPLLTERNAQDFRSHIAAYDSRMAAYEARIAKQDGRIAAMENAASAQSQQVAQAQSHIHVLTQQADLLKQTIAILNSRMDDRPAPTAAPTAAPDSTPTAGISADVVQQSVEPLKARIAEMEARLAQMAKAQTSEQHDARASAVSIALYNLRRAVNEGKPYAAELQSVSSLTPVPLELDALRAHGEIGVRSLQQLQASFEPAINAAIEAESKAGDSTVADGIWSRMKSVVRVRRVGEVEGDDTQAVLARAEVRLKAGDLRGTIAEAVKLKGEAAKALKPWLDAAKATLAADDAVTRAEAALLSALGDKAKRG